MKRAVTKKQRAWIYSDRFRAAALAAIRKINAGRVRLPRCGARRKSNGEPCRNLALENGRCRLHGGLTPKGKNWHRPQFRKSEKGIEKFLKKELDLERRKRKQRARVAAMTPEQRAAYEKWQREHRPGPASARQRGRIDREAGKWLSELLAAKSESTAASPEEDIFS